MGAIYRRPGDIIAITPTKKIEAGDVVKVGAFIGVATSEILANETGYINTRGEYDVEVTPGTAYSVGDLIEIDAKKLNGDATKVIFGAVLEPVDTTSKIARVRLNADKKVVADSSGGTVGSQLVAPAGSSWTKDEIAANFATLAAAINS